MSHINYITQKHFEQLIVGMGMQITWIRGDKTNSHHQYRDLWCLKVQILKVHISFAVIRLLSCPATSNKHAEPRVVVKIKICLEKYHDTSKLHLLLRSFLSVDFQLVTLQCRFLQSRKLIIHIHFSYTSCG